MYAQSRGHYYVQLEDDILTSPGSVSKMMKFALQMDKNQIDWFILDFCLLGFIGTLRGVKFQNVTIFIFSTTGKMFKNADLPYVIQFAIMFHNDKPIDWLLDSIFETKFCPNDSVHK